MDREHRYLVLKLKDLDGALNETERSILFQLSQKVDHYRTQHGKPWMKCVVVEQDWPEYEPTWLAIAQRVDLGTGEFETARESRIDQYERYS